MNTLFKKEKYFEFFYYNDIKNISKNFIKANIRSKLTFGIEFFKRFF